MAFCPSCGAQIDAGQNFCSKCGYDIKAHAGELAAPQQAMLTAPVYGMDATNLYILDESGVTSVGSAIWIVYLLLIGVIAFVTAVAIATSYPSFLPASVALFLVLLPVANKLRHTRLRKLLFIPRSDLLTKRGISTTPWESLSAMSIKGKTLKYEVGWKQRTMAIERSDVPALSAKAAHSLGAKFSQAPEKRAIPNHLKFAILALSLFAVTQVILIAASVTPFFPGEQARYTTLVNSTRTSFSGAPAISQFGMIFTNNVQVTLLSLLPGYGFIVLSAASYNTGRVIQVIAFQDGYSPSVILASLYLLPHSWVEEICYPLAEALGLYALIEWRKMTFKDYSVWWRRDRLTLGFAVIAGLLAVAATLEVTEPSLGSFALFLWAPVLLAAAYLYTRFWPRLDDIL